MSYYWQYDQEAHYAALYKDGFDEGYAHGRKQGHAQGLREGIEQGKREVFLEAIIRLVDSNLLTLEQGAKSAELTPEELQQIMLNNSSDRT